MDKKTNKKTKQTPVKKIKIEEVVELGLDLDTLDDVFTEEQNVTVKEIKLDVVEIGTPTSEKVKVKVEKPTKKVAEQNVEVDVPQEVKQIEPIVEPEIKSSTETTPQKLARGQKVFLNNENMKPYIVKKQDPIKPNKWHIQAVYGNGLANDIKVVDEKDIFTFFVN